MNAPNRNIQEAPQLGEGIYLTKDVADILRLPYSKVYYLMNGFWQIYTFGDKRNKAINFYALIEFFVYYHLRQHGMPAQRIKKYHLQMQKDLNTRYPFAHHDIRSDYKDIWTNQDGNLVKGDGKKQFDFMPILDRFLHRVAYGKNKIAEQYFPLEKSENIVVNPKHQFGQPVIAGTNIKTSTIYNLHKGGESNKIISNLYNIPVRKVRDAILFHANAA